MKTKKYKINSKKTTQKKRSFLDQTFSKRLKMVVLLLLVADLDVFLIPR